LWNRQEYNEECPFCGFSLSSYQSRLSYVNWGWALSGLFAALNVIIAYIKVDGEFALGFGLITICFIGMIWFGDEIGSLRKFFGFDGFQITRTHPGCVFRHLGWILSLS